TVPGPSASRMTASSDPELARLREEPHGVAEADPLDGFLAVPAAAELEDALGHGDRVAVAPVAGGVDPQPVAPAPGCAVDLDDVRRPLRCHLAVGVERHARPETRVECQLHRVLLDVVDQHPAW